MVEYLRNRPFLTVKLLQRPSPKTNTKEKGWQSKPGAMTTYEKVSFLDRINNEGEYAIIIDIINSAVIRNKSDKNENEIMANYLSKYKTDVTKALTVWAHKEAKSRAE